MYERKPSKEEMIDRIVDGLQCSIKEAQEIYEEDLRINKMSQKELDSDLTTDQKKVIKKMRGTGTRILKAQEKGETTTVVVKSNPTKEEMIKILFNFLCGESSFPCENVAITNITRRIDFTNEGTNYYLTLAVKKK